MSETYVKSVDLIRQGLTPEGYLAALEAHANYHRVWARDGIITGLAAILSNENDLIEGLKHTLLTLKTYQHSNGMIPSNIEFDINGNPEKISYGRLTGKVDTELWFIIGSCIYFNKTKDHQFKREVHQSIEKIIHLLQSWEFNGRGLLYVPQGGNWADEFILEGYNLSEQLLYYWALMEASRVFESELLQIKAQRLKQIIQINYWPSAENEDDAYHKTAFARLAKQGDVNYWIAGFKPSGYFHYFDCFAHALSFLLELNSASQIQNIKSSIEGIISGLDDTLLPSFYPFIEKGKPGWETLQNSWTCQFRNYPGAYQNGGVWPVFNGLLIAGLYKLNEINLADKLRQALLRAVALPDNTYGFYEYIDAKTWSVGGTKHQLWSAAGVIFAENAAQNIFLI